MIHYPESVPINKLARAKGTPLESANPIDDLDYVRAIATARIIMPHSYVRLSAGRETMSETMQALCFLAGANSIFYGEKLLVSPNPGVNVDQDFFKRLGLEPLIPPELMERTEMGCCADRPCMSE